MVVVRGLYLSRHLLTLSPLKMWSRNFLDKYHVWKETRQASQRPKEMSTTSTFMCNPGALARGVQGTRCDRPLDRPDRQVGK